MTKKEPKVSLVIIHYNTPHYLKTCLDNIFRQTYRNIEVFFIDNNSPDKSGVEFVKASYKKEISQKRLKVISNKDNLGYAKAANQGIDLAKDSDYVVITNPDIIYSPSYFEKTVHRAEKNPHIAAITGKVLKYDFKEKTPTKIIDTVGLYIDKSLRVTDGAQGVLDKGQFDREKAVFGVSGACPMYRRTALDDVCLSQPSSDGKKAGEYMDKDFFMYKEDVDLSWRFQLYGWTCWYYPKAVAFHGRGTGVIERRTLRQVLRNRKHLSKFQRYYSYRNQHLMNLKNTPVLTYLRYFPHILIKDLLSVAYTIFYEPFLFKAMWEYIKMAPGMMKKRKKIMKNKKASTRLLNKWMKARTE